MTYLLQLYSAHAFTLLTVLWVVAIARSLLFWLHYIQLKQYRIDRLVSEIKQPKFIKLIFSSYRSILIGFFLTWQLLLRTSISSQVGAFDFLLTAIIAFFLFRFIQTILHLKQHTLQIPTFTSKIWVLFVSILVVEIYLASRYLFWPEQLLAIEIIQPLIVFTVFSVLFIPNFLMQKQLMKKAREKMISHKDLIVIGITGSYGKTSMKELLGHILSKKYSVLKTPKHLNVDTGIAKLILDELQPTHEFFIVEMGAYREGEVKRIADIVSPDYGIMTGLTNQHLELFGSQKNIEKTKFELVKSVDDMTKVFANGESPELLEAFELRGISPITYGFAPDVHYSAQNIQMNKNESKFTLSEMNLSLPLFGKGHIINALGAIAIAKQLGMSLKEIQSALKTFPQIERTMEVKMINDDSWIIDDSYNANVPSILLAFDDVSSLDEKKILIFKEVIELADLSKTSHELIAKRASEVFDKILLLPSQQRDLLRLSLLQQGFPEESILHPKDQESLLEFVRNQPTVVLCEGRESEQFIPNLLTDS